MEENRESGIEETKVSTEGEGVNSNTKEDDVRKIEEKMRIQSQRSSGYTWFYWIAGLSIVNTLLYMFGSNWNFIIGLGVTQIIDGIAYELQGFAKIVALIIDFIFIGLFVLFGKLSQRGYNWAYIVGMVIYALDGIIFLIFQDWVGIGFHVLGLYGIYKGLKANLALKKLESNNSLYKEV